VTDRTPSWVVVDDRVIDPDTLAGAVASQATLGALLAYLRATAYPQLPAPPRGEVAP